MYTLRFVTEADWPLWQRLHREAYQERVVELWGKWDISEQEKFARSEFENPKHVGQFVVVVQGKDIGYMSYQIEEKEMFLVNIVLDKAMRGKGLGAVILRDLQELARRKKLPLRLQTFVNNPAQRLYARLGFQTVEKTDKRIVMRWFA